MGDAKQSQSIVRSLRDSLPPQNCFEILSDEIIVGTIVPYLGDARTLVRLGEVNKRFRGLLLGDATTLRRLIDDRVDLSLCSTCCSSLKELGFYQSALEKGIFDENRIGFDFASTQIDDDDGEASLIKGSMTRIGNFLKILEEFHEATLTIEAHCGTAAPASIAPRFSRARGQSVLTEIMENEYNLTWIPDIEQRITVNPWGRRVAFRASESSHVHGILARQGRGWVEIFVNMNQLELPKRPSYYDGMQLFQEEEEDAGLIRFRFLW